MLPAWKHKGAEKLCSSGPRKVSRYKKVALDGKLTSERMKITQVMNETKTKYQL